MDRFPSGADATERITTRVHMPDLLLLAFCSGLGALAYLGTLTAPAYVTGLVLFFLSGMMLR